LFRRLKVAMKWDRWRLLRVLFAEVIPRVALVWILVVCGMNWLNNHLVYAPQREWDTVPTDYNIPYEDVTFVTADAVKLSAWYIPAQAPAGTVLFCHGNGGNISHRIDTITVLRKLGMNVLVFDYRGYGKSEGSPSEEGTYRDAEAAWAYLVETRREKPERIVIHGQSLGGAVAAHLAMSRTPAGLIVESSFYDITELGAELFRWLPVRWLSRMKYSTAEYVKGARCPVLVIHSRDDDMIAPHHGQKIFAAAPQPKRMLEIHGDHNYGFSESSEIYNPALRQFFAEVLDKPANQQP
jgi:hypothetical protein